MNWVTLDRNTPFRYPQALECPTCGALCATEEAICVMESDSLVVDEGGRAVLDAEKLFAKASVKIQLEALLQANLTGAGE